MTEYSIGKKKSAIFFSIQPLFYPVYQSVKILDYDVFEGIIKEIQELLNSYEISYEKKEKDAVIISKGFSIINIEKFNAIKDLIKNSNENTKKNKENFMYFLEQVKIRNNKSYNDFFNDKNYFNYFQKIESSKIMQNDKRLNIPLIYRKK